MILLTALALLMAPTAAAPVILSAPAQPQPQHQPAELDPTKMTTAQINSHNTGLDRKDPNYIRCERYAAPNSLVRNLRICRTNAQWAYLSRIGQENARDTAEAMRSRPEGPPDPVCKDASSC